ncbi:hypothetical protein [Lacticaseibacillus absianus]|uniref:hypothetical protein n=1 Tax=Lacticaseibacillus absianus TaxID=2729623 RepID=UPI0015CA52AE|nr:hypothetical protein [Lacticaseibacillus absianus]
MIQLQQVAANGEVIATTSGASRADLARHHGFARGDAFVVTVPQTPVFLMVQLDAALAPALIYLTTPTWRYQIPQDDQREWPYPASAFRSRLGYATVRFATPAEVQAAPNLALNTHDQHEASGAFPHVQATAETRGETVFYAKNAIDGIVANDSHGNWPFQSWGIDQDPTATLTLDFGRPVTLTGIGLVLRADYPHDSYWTALDVVFEDGSTVPIATTKTAACQRFDFPARTVSWLRLTHLIKAPDSATFPALTQLEAYGPTPA